MAGKTTSNNPAGRGESEGGATAFLQKFIDRYYLKQNRAVQTLTFLTFVALLSYSFARTVAGDYAVGGFLIEAKGGVRRPARDYEIRYGGKFFPTNSKGLYTVILSAPAYAAMLVTGSLELTAVRPIPDCSMCRCPQEKQNVAADDAERTRRVECADAESYASKETVPFRRLTKEFDDWVVGDEPAKKVKVQRPSLWQAGVVHAASAGTRLFVGSITLGFGGSTSINCTLEASTTTAGAPLQSARAGGIDVGTLRLLPFQALQLGEDYYFDLKDATPGKTPVTITLKSLPSILQLSFGATEYFHFQLPNDGQKLTPLKGDHGSELRVKVVRESSALPAAQCAVTLKQVRVVHDGTSASTHWRFSVKAGSTVMTLPTQTYRSPKSYTAATLHPTPNRLSTQCGDGAPAIEVTGIQTNHPNAAPATGKANVRRGDITAHVQGPKPDDGEFYFDFSAQ
jgi:hypothetical protein